MKPAFLYAGLNKKLTSRIQVLYKGGLKWQYMNIIKIKPKLIVYRIT